MVNLRISLGSYRAVNTLRLGCKNEVNAGESNCCSEIRTKHINILCGQNVEFLNVKCGGTYSYHWTDKGLNELSTLNFHRTEDDRNAMYSQRVYYSI
jgi:hypothetical protein